MGHKPGEPAAFFGIGSRSPSAHNTAIRKPGVFALKNPPPSLLLTFK